MSESGARAPQKFISFPGKIHLIRSNEELSVIQLKDVTQIGFDTETRPAFKKGEVHKVALVQIATDHDAYLVRLHFISDFGLLKEVFESQDIIKAGVALHDDLKGLQKIFPFVPRGFVDLQKIAKAKGLQNQGLKGMTAEVLGATLTKGPKLTNWEARDLTPPQLMYAATDAWIGLELYRALAVT